MQTGGALPWATGLWEEQGPFPSGTRDRPLQQIRDQTTFHRVTTQTRHTFKPVGASKHGVSPQVPHSPPRSPHTSSTR